MVRKSRLFAGTAKGVRAGVDLHILSETTTANGLEPYRYLPYLFENLLFAQSTEDYQALLSLQLRAEDIALNNIVAGG